jgi:hypothetical protein
MDNVDLPKSIPSRPRRKNYAPMMHIDRVVKRCGACVGSEYSSFGRVPATASYRLSFIPMPPKPS